MQFSAINVVYTQQIVEILEINIDNEFHSSLHQYKYEGVGDALEKHHNTSPDCSIVTLNSSLYLDYFAIFIKQYFARRLSYTCTIIYVCFKVI